MTRFEMPDYGVTIRYALSKGGIPMLDDLSRFYSVSVY